MRAIEKAKKMGAEAVIEKIDSFGIKEYGVFGTDLAQKWRHLLSTSNSPMKVAAAINNCDTDRAVLTLLKQDYKKVLEGMEVAAYVLQAEEKVLYLPEGEIELKETLEQIAAQYGVQVKTGFINVRAWSGHGLHHIATMADVADALNDVYEAGVYLAVKKDGKMDSFAKVSYGTKLRDLVDLESVKAVEIGYNLYPQSKAYDLEIGRELSVGNGVITPILNTDCLMQETEKRLLTARKNGCGKCVFCREGLNQLYGHITDITGGKGKKENLDMIKEIGEAMQFSCGCSVGTVGADFVLDAMENFMDEFDAHIKKRSCPAGVCTCFTTFYVDPNVCQGCEECADACPEDCIEGKAGYIHMIDTFDCTKCGKCAEACTYDAVVQTTGRVPKLPARLVKCGKFKKRS